MAAIQTLLATITPNLTNLFGGPPQSALGSIDIEVSINEAHNDTLELTDHPVEAGADITDHSFKKPVEITLECGWSNSGGSGFLGLGGLLPGSNQAAVENVATSNGVSSQNDRISAVYSQLRALQESRTPFSITTSLWSYNNMLITALRATRDQRTANVLMLTVTCREVIFASARAANFVPQANQADPASTAAVQNVGQVTLKPGTPAPGGSAPPSTWGTN